MTSVREEEWKNRMQEALVRKSAAHNVLLEAMTEAYTNGREAWAEKWLQRAQDAELDCKPVDAENYYETVEMVQEKIKSHKQIMTNAQGTPIKYTNSGINGQSNVTSTFPKSKTMYDEYMNFKKQDIFYTEAEIARAKQSVFDQASHPETL
tara:strand:- start:169620 stop:170072 length:453 start_codon:yes stop_codon:yes gene_type:complete